MAIYGKRITSHPAAMQIRKNVAENEYFLSRREYLIPTDNILVHLHSNLMKIRASLMGFNKI